jgi:hypothetical protein
MHSDTQEPPFCNVRRAAFLLIRLVSWHEFRIVDGKIVVTSAFFLAG